ncbi:hypothetical protein EGW08_008644 [Elysia chlorotica]|uniref:DDE-1 domain-containing protein n=1 Tax=Elysia chlorotica TaxID=188477 RepID=A0A3S1BLH5_ELYCH|nr:hypothetical protein EGW08_008644 [Elysia chlorotica]
MTVIIKYSKPSAESPVLLLLDNHVSHLYIPAIDLCKENHITLLSLPPHTSHKMQPLDRVVYGPLKTYISNRCHAWTRENPGKPLSIYDIPSIVGTELPRAMSQFNIIESFRCTGIWPVNRNVFNDSDFAAAEVTDRPMPATATTAASTSAQPVGPAASTSAQPVGPAASTSAQPVGPAASTSAQPVGPAASTSAQPVGPAASTSAQPVGPAASTSAQPVGPAASTSSAWPLFTQLSLCRVTSLLLAQFT